MAFKLAIEEVSDVARRAYFSPLRLSRLRAIAKIEAEKARVRARGKSGLHSARSAITPFGVISAQIAMSASCPLWPALK